MDIFLIGLFCKLGLSLDVVGTIYSPQLKNN